MNTDEFIEVLKAKDAQIRDLQKELHILRQLEGIALWKKELDERVVHTERLQSAILKILDDEQIRGIKRHIKEDGIGGK